MRNRPVIRGTRSKGNTPATNIPKLRVNISCIGSPGGSLQTRGGYPQGVFEIEAARVPSRDSEYRNIFSYPARKYWNSRNSPDSLFVKAEECAITRNATCRCNYFKRITYTVTSRRSFKEHDPPACAKITKINHKKSRDQKSCHSSRLMT